MRDLIKTRTGRVTVHITRGVCKQCERVEWSDVEAMDARHRSIDRRRRRGIRRGGAIADERGEMDVGKPIRCVRDVRGARRRATPSTRDASVHADASSCTPHPMRVRDCGISRHDTTTVATRVARVQRENRTKRFLHHPIAFARVDSRPSARPVSRQTHHPSRRVTRVRASPVCFFASPPAKIFVHADVSPTPSMARPGASLVDVPTRRARVTNPGFRGTTARSRRRQSSRVDRRRGGVVYATPTPTRRGWNREDDA